MASIAFTYRGFIGSWRPFRKGGISLASCHDLWGRFVRKWVSSSGGGPLLRMSGDVRRALWISSMPWHAGVLRCVGDPPAGVSQTPFRRRIHCSWCSWKTWLSPWLPRRPGTHPLPADACSYLDEAESPVCDKTGWVVGVAFKSCLQLAYQWEYSRTCRRGKPDLCLLSSCLESLSRQKMQQPAPEQQ